jgi:cell division septation protein DedD
MENRVRDLEQIQEHEGDDRGRRIGALLMAALALVGLTFAIGVVVGRAAEPSDVQPQEDPLAKLDRGRAGTAPKLAPAKSAAVNAADLSFPNTLTEAEERPEVLAALKAAADEAAALANAQAASASAAGSIPAVSDVVAIAPSTALPAAEIEDEVSTEDLVASVPAAVAAGAAGRSLPRAMRNDPMVASAIRSGENDESVDAPHGHDGELTLQVISYDRPEPARAFAAGLRDKGHEAFVTAADVDERGRFYRVRIGPFKSRQQADTYRRKFEQEEHMNTFVVRRKED